MSPLAEHADELFAKHVFGQASDKQLASEYGYTVQRIGQVLRPYERAHVETVIEKLWLQHKETRQPLALTIPSEVAFWHNAAFHYGMWLAGQFTKRRMNVAIQPYLDETTGDVVFGLIDVDFMRAMERE
jgi:hypothetical protein